MIKLGDCIMKEKIPFFKYLKWIIAGISLLIFIVFLNLINSDVIEIFDTFYYKYISLLISPRMTFFVKIITHLGSSTALISIALIILLLSKEKKQGILVGINLLIVFLFNLLLKSVFSRPRPIDIHLIEASGYSFPSGHAMISTAFYGFLIYLIWKTKMNKKIKWLYTILLSILVLLICITRVYLGVHYASDVLAGFFIAITYLIIFISVVSKFVQKKESSK
jgi:undecaprenyl-diphosphatase